MKVKNTEKWIILFVIFSAVVLEIVECSRKIQ